MEALSKILMIIMGSFTRGYLEIYFGMVNDNIMKGLVIKKVIMKVFFYMMYWQLYERFH